MASLLYYIYRDPAQSTVQNYIGTVSLWLRTLDGSAWDEATRVTSALSVLRANFEGFRSGIVTAAASAKALVLFNVGDIT